MERQIAGPSSIIRSASNGLLHGRAADLATAFRLVSNPQVKGKGMAVTDTGLYEVIVANQHCWCLQKNLSDLKFCKWVEQCGSWSHLFDRGNPIPCASADPANVKHGCLWIQSVSPISHNCFTTILHKIRRSRESGSLVST